MDQLIFLARFRGIFQTARDAVKLLLNFCLRHFYRLINRLALCNDFLLYVEGRKRNFEIGNLRF